MMRSRLKAGRSRCRRRRETVHVGNPAGESAVRRTAAHDLCHWQRLYEAAYSIIADWLAGILKPAMGAGPASR